MRPHEQTHRTVKGERLDLLRATRTNLSPIFALYDDEDGRVTAALAGAAEGEPAMQAIDADGTVHRFWPVTDPARIAEVQTAMAEREVLMADGHHRYETALAYRDEQREREGDPDGDRPYDFVLGHLADVAAPGLTIFPPTAWSMSQREVDARFLSAFDARAHAGRHAGRGGRGGADAIPSEKVAFALWRGAGAPAAAVPRWPTRPPP